MEHIEEANAILGVWNFLQRLEHFDRVGFSIYAVQKNSEWLSYIKCPSDNGEYYKFIARGTELAVKKAAIIAAGKMMVEANKNASTIN